jgi:hypothetical protein
MRTNATAQRVCIWCGLVFVLAFFAAFLIAAFLPPPYPSSSAAEILRIYQNRTNQIRLAGILMGFCGALIFPFTAAISIQLKRIEGRFAPYSYTQLLAGGVTVMIFITTVSILQAAAYRPDIRSPEITLVLNDFFWLMFIGTPSTVIIQVFAIGLAILQDHSETPIFPRWVGYYNVWVGLLLLPGLVIPFFKTGPLDWAGAFAFWLPLSVFGSWFIVMMVMLLRAVRTQEAEEHAGLAMSAP